MVSVNPPLQQIECDIAIIGAGVVGLAVATKLSKDHAVIVLEGQSKFGQDISSRNSEVIHSSIYYPKDSLKTRLCLEGQGLLYEFCQRFNVPHLRCGKLLVAAQSDEMPYLEKVSNHCTSIGVKYEAMDGPSVKRLQPELQVHSALHFPNSGIVDSHALMAQLEALAISQGTVFAYQHRAIEFHIGSDHCQIHIKSPGGELQVAANRMINCAGLAAAQIANLALGKNRFEHRYCRGRYMGLSTRFRNVFKKLVYPVPPKDGLGIHITISLDGNARLGPDVDWSSETSYENSLPLYDEAWTDALKDTFASSAQRYCPQIELDDLNPGFVGLRPKLFINGKAYPDFYFHQQNSLISCLGVESPGLTSALAIAERLSKPLE